VEPRRSKTLRANPGGQLSVSEVRGRDELVDRVWRSLERQSVLLTAERRMGKTTLMSETPDQDFASYIGLGVDLHTRGIRGSVRFF